LLVVAATDRELASVHGVDTLSCGIGPVEAALQTARALAELQPDAVLHIGIAGARGVAAPALVLGSASVYTREKMDQLVVDNIAAWAAGKPPLTPVSETPPKRS